MIANDCKSQAFTDKHNSRCTQISVTAEMSNAHAQLKYGKKYLERRGQVI